MRPAATEAPNAPTPRSAWRRWLPRVLWAAATGAVLAWVLEPCLRREILFERAVTLTTGTEVRGTFTPNLAADNRTGVGVRFPGAGLTFTSRAEGTARAAATRRLKDLLGEAHRLRGHDGGLRVVTTITVAGRIVFEGREQGDLGEGGAYAHLYLTSFRAHAEVEHAFMVRIEHADAALAGFQAHVVVVNSGDWWSYANLEQAFRVGCVLVAGLIAAVVLALRRPAARPRTA